MKYVIEGKDVFRSDNNIPVGGVVVDTSSIYQIGTIYRTHVGRPAEVKCVLKQTGFKNMSSLRNSLEVNEIPDNRWVDFVYKSQVVNG